MRSEQKRLLDLISLAFPPNSQLCVITLRQGDEIDSYNTPTLDALPADWTEVSDVAMERHYWGFTHLDAESWRFYLPAFLAYSVRHPSRGESLVIDACINNLRPPDRTPSRFKTLTHSQLQAVVAVLEFLAFDAESQFQNNACQVLEEYWIERRLYPDN